MLKFLIAAVAILALLFAPLAYNEYQTIQKLKQMQDFVDKTPMPFEVFRPPAISVSGITNYTKLQMAITDDGIVYYYGKSEYAPSLIEPDSLIIVQHVYIENNSIGGFATEKDGQKYYFLPFGGFRALSTYRNTTHQYPTEIIAMYAGEKIKIDFEHESIYSKKMLEIIESMR